MTKKPFEQGTGSGLCAVYAIINSLSVVFPSRVTAESQEELLGALTDAYPSDVRDLIKDGCERPEVEVMLSGVRQWTADKRWPAWEWRALHPVSGESAMEFFDAVRAELDVPHTAAIVGFGKDTKNDTRYEPHWSVVSRVTDSYLWLLDSSDYRRVARSSVGIRPQRGWAVEDAFILGRE